MLVRRARRLTPAVCRHSIPLGGLFVSTMLRKVFANLAGPLLELSKDPNFVFNRSHYFLALQRRAALGDDEHPLTDFLKTFSGQRRKVRRHTACRSS